MRRTRSGTASRLGGAALVLLVAGVGCTGGSPGDGARGAWAAEAQAWVDSYDLSSATTDSGRLGAFYATDVLAERREESYYGRVAVVALEQSLEATSARHDRGPLYLDAGGFLRSESFTWREPGRPPEPTLRLWDVADDGLVAMRWYAWTGNPLVRDNPALDGPRVSAVRLADAYAAAWSTADHAALRALYAPTVTLRDDVAGLSATGREAVVALADPATATVVRVERADDVYLADVLERLRAVPSEPAVYLAGGSSTASSPDPLRFVLLQRSTTACPGASAVELTVDDAARVVAERRLHAVVSVRACGAGASEATAWWSGRRLPRPLSQRLTGHVESAAGAVAVYNGTPELDAFVRWGLETYTAAGIAPPGVSAVAFDPFAAGCRDVGAYTSARDGSTTITICAEAVDLARGGRTDGPGCSTDCLVPPRGRHALLLHELGHAWLIAHAGAATSEEFRVLVGAPTWSDPATPASDRGVEIAAWTLAWGVSGAAGASPGQPCAVLAAGFRLLTGVEPVASCP